MFKSIKKNLQSIIKKFKSMSKTLAVKICKLPKFVQITIVAILAIIGFLFTLNPLLPGWLIFIFLAEILILISNKHKLRIFEYLNSTKTKYIDGQYNTFMRKLSILGYTFQKQKLYKQKLSTILRMGDR